MRRARFERLVAQALDNLPPQFAQRLTNIAVIVEPRPSREVAKDLGADILGLYQGASELEQSPMAPYELPEVIVVYQENIEAVCRTDEEIIEEIRKTVIHEVGHHFGLSDDQMEAWETDPDDD
ncbi:MAG: metallopeptidase family protein [Bacillati bacterium ANGP1]|uniref:Metallopeptidase family protein n=1 Tax=Candidatus Segetimicrobium genomatis TaxID=2569760 RepID=A0A537JGQ9_9BACT|nr:MAG: metallopeptidase family protein [Terrabacteria group bacterium ANGP1]